MKKKGFTLVELLVVISIIALLIGIIVPAVSKMRILAKDLQESAQLKVITQGIETSANENDNIYPSSDENVSDTGVGKEVFGAHLLVEALVGRDLFGNAPDGNLIPNELYSAVLQERKEYIDKAKFLIVNPAQIYDNTILPAGDDSLLEIKDYYPVISDVYFQKRITVKRFDSPTGQWQDKNIMVGTPVLYFKANNTELFMDSTVAIGTTTVSDISYNSCSNWVYDYNDNEGLFNLATVSSFGKSEKYHEYDELHNGTDVGKAAFYKDIINYKVPTYLTPVNKDSYILMSAGIDGIFGTEDDIKNF